MNYKQRQKKMEMELEIRRSVYCDIISDMFDKKDYEDMNPRTRLEVITILKSFSKLINRYQS